MLKVAARILASHEQPVAFVAVRAMASDAFGDVAKAMKQAEEEK